MAFSLEYFFQNTKRILDKNLFFLSGTEKSGTTWLQMLCNEHPQAVCMGEGQFGTKLWPDLRKALNEYSTFITSLNEKVFNEIDQFPIFDESHIAAIQKFSASLLLSEYGNQREILAIGEKTPGHVRTLERLKTLFPSAKFVFIIRDGRDIAVSGWYHLKRQYGDDQAGDLDKYAKRIASTWRNDYEKMRIFSQKYPDDAILVRYEDLHRDAILEMERLFAFLGLDGTRGIVKECVDACRFSKLSKGRTRGEENEKSHFRKGIIGDWVNNFSEEAWHEFDTEAGELLDELGYSREFIFDNNQENRDYSINKVLSVNYDKNIESSYDNPILSCEEACNVAKQLMKNKDWNGVIALLERTHDVSECSFESWYLLGEAYRAIENFLEAGDAFKECTILNSKDRDAQFMYAASMGQSDSPELAENAFEKLLSDYPKDAQGWIQYGLLLQELDRIEDAIKAFRRSLDINTDIPTYNALVIALIQKGDSEQAIVEGGKLLEIKNKYSHEAFKSSKYSSIRITPNVKEFNYSEPRKNIISFSLWGNDPVYIHGAIVNAQIAPNIYYGWKARFYCDETVPSDALDELNHLGAETIVIEDPELQKIRPLWRFLVSDDPNVDRFICRDADSRLNVQELLAVEEWVHSNKSFHVMRDHIYHMELILAGMWGGVAGVLPHLTEMIFSDPRYTNNPFGDQLFLMELVWPLIHNDVLIHDSYYKFANSKEFPTNYRLPGLIHVGGAIKNMPSWRRDKN